MTINLLDRRNRDTDLAALTSRHNANLPSSLQLLSPLFLYLSKFLAFRSSFCPESWNLGGKILISINYRFLYPEKSGWNLILIKHRIYSLTINDDLSLWHVFEKTETDTGSAWIVVEGGVENKKAGGWLISARLARSRYNSDNGHHKPSVFHS